MLREVSVVAVGADAQTTMKVTAKFNLSQTIEGDRMTKEIEENCCRQRTDETQEPVVPPAANRKRSRRTHEPKEKKPEETAKPPKPTDCDPEKKPKAEAVPSGDSGERR